MTLNMFILVQHQCLITLSQLIAPLAPFIAEEIYQNLVCSIDPGAKESIHLTDYPVADETKIDEELNKAVELAMKISSLGRTARAKAGIKVRQPLSKIVVEVESREEEKALTKFTSDILAEVNVKEIVILNHREGKTSQEFSGNTLGYSIYSQQIISTKNNNETYILLSHPLFNTPA